LPGGVLRRHQQGPRRRTGQIVLAIVNKASEPVLRKYVREGGDDYWLPTTRGSPPTAWMKACKSLAG